MFYRENVRNGGDVATQILKVGSRLHISRASFSANFTPFTRCIHELHSQIESGREGRSDFAGNGFTIMHRS